MNEVVETEQKQIFEVKLESSELEAVNVLVSKHKSNAAFTQQLALDASRLVTTSQERLVKQSKAGFFKRLTSAISGKTSENQLLNQMDMLEMQKFAWHYLQQLQQQNLINAQSIAVIRNNLGMMNEYIIETRDFLELAIDKIDNRLRHVENNTGFNNWSLNIESNKRRLKSTPKTLLILRLTYDFMRSHRDIVLTERDISNYLVTTLEKLEINCDKDVKLLDFISELIDQIDVVGIDQYRAMIELSVDEHTVDSDYIQKNISGIGFNALYFLSDHYEKIVDLIGDDELCNTDEAREKITAKFFGSEFSGLSSTYSIRNLICEMIGGSQLAIDVYKDEYGLNVVQGEVAEEPQPEVITLVSSLPVIHAHTFLDSHESDESKRNYLLLLALCVENSVCLNTQAREFIVLLAEKLGTPELHEEILKLADNPNKYNEYQPVMQVLLNDNDKKYTWLLDSFFLLTLAEKPIRSQEIKIVLGILKPGQLKECFQNMLVIINGSDASQVLDAGIKINTSTNGWRNIVRYRELRFDHYFAETVEQLNSASLAVTLLNLEMSKVYMKEMEYAVFVSFSDGSLLSNLTDKAGSALFTQGRKSVVSSLNEIRKKAKDFILENKFALSGANSLISRWSMPSFEFKDGINYADFDLNNSAANDDWDNQFMHYYHQIEDTLNSFSRACDDATEQLGFFTKGNFDQSVLKLREEKRAEYLRQQQLEKLKKQSVTVMRDGMEHLFSIEWQQIESPPCDPDKIIHIETDSKIWLIVAKVNSDEVFYRSEDGVHWEQIQLDIPGIKIWFKGVDVVNGVWIIKNSAMREGTRDEGFYYSTNAITWRHTPAPEPLKRKLSINDGCIFFNDIIYFNNLWIWCGNTYEKYNYTEKGFFSDSIGVDNYGKIILYCAKNLDGPWQPWDQTPKFPEGVEVKIIRSLPGKKSLLAFCKYNYSYIQNKKKPEVLPFVMHYGAAKAWQKCTWGGSTNFSHSGKLPIFASVGDELVYFSSGEILTSDKGYEWSKQEATLYADDYFPLRDLSLFIRNTSSVIYVSQDAKLFKELVLEDGTWRYLTANEAGILGVYYANKHEETVLRVGRYIWAHDHS